MKNILKDKIFWIFFLGAAGIFFIMSANNSRTYQAKSRIMFVPKNEVTARNISQAVENAKQVPLSLSFYNKITELNGDIADGALELPDAKRKEYWNSKIETSQVGKSSVVEVAIFDDSQMQAEIISDQTVAGILTVMGNYYGAGNSLDMRVIDKSVSQETARIDYFQAGLISIMAGIVMGALISILFNFAFDFFDKGVYGDDGSSFDVEPLAFPKASLSEEMDKSAPVVEKKENIFDFKAEDEASLVSQIKSKKFGFLGLKEKKASAPSNLPIAEEFDLNMAAPENVPAGENLKNMAKYGNMPAQEDEFVFDMGGMKNDSVATASAATIDADNKREATPEEVKMRLNKLLSGDTSK